MKIKRYLAIIICLIICLQLVSAINAKAQSISYYNDNIKKNQMYYWRIISISDKPIAFYDFSWQFRGKIDAENDTYIVFYITSISGLTIYGRFIMGNFTTNATKREIASVLVFSIGTWYPGFFITKNLTQEKQWAIANASSGWSAGTLNIINNTHNITFDYKQGSGGNQNTTLTYDLNSGILLEGFYELNFTNYVYLHIKFIGVEEIPETSNPTNTFPIGIESLIYIIPCLLIISGIIVFLKNKRNIKEFQ
ncbi:MAG: hypothetical protein ACTSRP_09840 [Candidatus Helarchaeota archaeon]